MPGQVVDLTGLAVDLAAKGDAVRAAVNPALRECGEIGVALVKGCFDQSRDPAGRPWAPLLDGSGRKPLIGMRESTHYKVDGAKLTIFNAHPYADIHNTGALINYPEQRRGPGQKPFVFEGRDGETVFTRHIRAHTKRIPRRTFLDFSPEWVRVWIESIGRVIQRGLGR